MTMSRLNFRVILAVLISLAVIFAVYTTVQSASLSAAAEKVGSHSVSGAMTNFNHDRFTVAEQEAFKSELESYNKSSTGRGHGCEDEAFNSPID
jgi:ABC-type xylose transport system substrate-binding protein